MKSQAVTSFVKILALQSLVFAACLGVICGCNSRTSGDDPDARGVATLAGSPTPESSRASTSTESDLRTVRQQLVGSIAVSKKNGISGIGDQINALIDQIDAILGSMEPGQESANGVRIQELITKASKLVKAVDALASVSPTATPTPKPNSPPSVVFTAPAAAASYSIGSSILLNMTASDLDNDTLTITLYSKSTATGACAAGGTYLGQIGGSNATYSWNTTGLGDGLYYVCARVSDGVATAETFSWRIALYPSGTCTWLGDSSSAWTSAANWVGCPGAGAPVSTDGVLILQQAANQPSLAANATVANFAQGTGGGTLTIGAGAVLTVSSASSLESSVTLLGNSATCTSCSVSTSGVFSVVKGASLTLGSGLTLVASKLQIGDGTTGGSFTTTAASSDQTRWPRIGSCFGSTYCPTSGIVVQGSSGQVSHVRIDGLNLLDVQPTGSNNAIQFVSYYAIDQFDNVSIGYNQGSVAILQQPSILLSSCTGAVFNDLSWTNIIFTSATISRSQFGVGSNIHASACSSIGPITVTGSGLGYGSKGEVDANNVINWTNGASFNCSWDAAGADTNWFNAANWLNCVNGRGGYPDQNDYAIVPAAANFQPTISQTTALLGFGAGSGGGTVTINPGANLIIPPSTNTVLSSITLQGATSTCTTCLMSATVVEILNGATLTLKSGVKVRNADGSAIKVGSSSQTGHFKALPGSASTADWPTIDAYIYYTLGISVTGPSTGTKSSIEIDGLKIVGMRHTSSGLGVDLQDYYRVIHLRNFSMNMLFAGATDATYLKVRNCAHSTFDDLQWTAMDFIQPLNTGHNIDIQGCSGLGAAPAVGVSQLGGGTNAGYGAAFATDPDGMLSWQ